MGVPKFFRWISERYPKINQRVAFEPTLETHQEHFGNDSIPPDPPEEPDLMARCSQPPPIDRLYIDMNGIIHGCSHNNENSSATNDDDESPPPISHQEIFQNVCYYLDRVIGEMVQPTELVYMAIDGVAPRAKLNQQRARRYRSDQEGEIERTIYEAHLQQEQKQDDTKEHDNYNNTNDMVFQFDNEAIQQVEPGRFTGTFEAHDENHDNSIDNGGKEATQQPFHPNSITPGSTFFTECTAHLEHFIKYKLSTDPKWQHLTIIFSGSNVPGEGEHKIMDFIRKEQRSGQGYHPNLRHCIMGQDGDLIMLGLVTHERNLVLLREEVVFDQRRKKLLTSHPPPNKDGKHYPMALYIFNQKFEFLHMSILRDYLAYEFETSQVTHSPWDLKHTIDDFVFLTFFVGNDFLPHMPALDIADEAFDLLFHTYKEQRVGWINDQDAPYLTQSGTIVSGRRLQDFLTTLGGFENVYYDNKKKTATRDNDKWRKQDFRANREPTIPSDAVMESKEEADRAEYRDMLESAIEQEPSSGGSSFIPVLSNDVQPNKTTFVPEKSKLNLDDGLLSRFSKLLQYSASPEQSQENSENPALGTSSLINDQDLKGRYYFGKFQFTPYDAEKHVALRKAYIEGLVWNLKYYYEGCVSWDWYYPYHYGPMLSDLVDIDEMLEEISFDHMGEPLRPYEQLMGCLPPSSAHLLPEQYRWLLTEESSPIKDFYPRSFTVDMNGKRWPWEAVVLLPFIDSKRLVDAARTLVTDDVLSDDERQRNSVGKPVVFTHSAQHVERNVPGMENASQKHFERIEECTAWTQLLEATVWGKEHHPLENTVLNESPPAEPQAGFPTISDAPIQSLWRRRIGINVFGLRSRYVTAILDMADNKPPLPPVSVLGPEFVGTTVFIGYPYLSEGFVTAVSDSEMTVRGHNPPRPWTEDEKTLWTATRKAFVRKGTHGEGLPGSGGWKLPESETTFSVRPLWGIESLPDGSSVKVFAKFEVEVPIDAALLSPSCQDPRFANIPARLEKDPCFVEDAGKPIRSEELAKETGGVNGAVVDSLNASRSSQSAIETPPSSRPPNGDSLLLPDTIPHRKIIPRTQIGNQTNLDSRPLSSPATEASLAARPLSVNTQIANPGTTYASTHEWSNALPRAGGPVVKELTRPKDRNPGTRRHYFTSYHSTPANSVGWRGARGRGRLVAFGAVAAMSFFAKGALGMYAAPLAHMCSPTVRALRGGDQDDYFVKNDIGSATPPPLEFYHGTTTLSFLFKGGIVVAVDSRASIGNFVGSKTVQKVLPINEHMLGTMAGGAADCSFWIRRLKAEAMLHELTEGRRMSVARASRVLSNALYQTRGLDLSMGTMIMGFDQDGGPSIYYVDNTGVRIGGDMFSVGSGSTFALGILDTERLYDMTEDDAVALGIKAIRHATFRDAYSGGFINVYLVTKDGWKKVFSEDLALAADHVLKEAKGG